MSTCENIVYLIGGDSDQSLSVKFLLESYQCQVKEVSAIDSFMDDIFLQKSDIVLVDLKAGGAEIFRVINDLLEAPIKPRIIITADHTHDLRPNDIFLESEVEILLHPVNPKELVRLIMRSRNLN